ncbi:MAG: MFS transporter [Acidobacteriota bacterium]
MNPWRGLSKLPSEVWILFTTTLINRAGTMVLPYMIIYLTTGLKFSIRQAGLIITLYGIGALFTAPLAGKLSDWIGPIRVMKYSLFFSGTILLIFPLAQSFPAVIGLTLIFAITNEAFRPASLAATTELVASEQRKSAFALTRLAVNIGMSIGPAIGGILTTISFKALFLVDASTSLLAGLVILLAGWQMRPASTSAIVYDSEKQQLHRRVSVLTDRNLLLFLLAMIPVEMVFFQHQTTVPLFWDKDLHISPAWFGVLFSVNTILIIFLELPLNAAMADWPHRRALALGALLVGLGFGGMFFANGLFTVAVTVVIWTFGEMILLPTSAAYVADIAPAERRGEYMGLFTMSFSLAFTLSPWLGTEVYQRLGARTLWLATLLCGVVSTIMIRSLKSTGAELEKVEKLSPATTNK